MHRFNQTMILILIVIVNVFLDFFSHPLPVFPLLFVDFNISDWIFHSASCV